MALLGMQALRAKREEEAKAKKAAVDAKAKEEAAKKDGDAAEVERQKKRREELEGKIDRMHDLIGEIHKALSDETSGKK